jgi:hypothetical protein
MATPIIGDFTVFTKTATIVYGDTSDTRLFDLPAHAHIVDILVDVQTGFGGTGTLDVGKHGNSDYFIDGLDVSATGRKSPTLLECGEDLGSRLTDVQIVVDATTQGSLTLTFLYFCFDRSHLH